MLSDNHSSFDCPRGDSLNGLGGITCPILTLAELRSGFFSDDHCDKVRVLWWSVAGVSLW